MKPLFYLVSLFCLATLLFSYNETNSSSNYKSEELTAGLSDSDFKTHEWEWTGNDIPWEAMMISPGDMFDSEELEFVTTL